ncbi:hypothetical protein QFC20_007243 [Naganishia adeliensis]|uniref:Uncharacterized protein n=1 Tax=Naganishia adeliensis TaxID=92952 RepID=A0ACC2V1H2_9TREE|nr:hypothetical protein QFC20_007243 [Naganishia adeliensis]
MSLPIEVIGIVAKQLIPDSQFGSCAALNRTCHAVYSETLRILWRICVFWASNVLKTLPPATWSTEDLPWEEDPHRNAKEDVCEQWDMLIDSPGAQYIEYLAVPFASSQDRPHIEFTARIRSTEPDIFPNLKAAFVVFHSTGDGITPREPIPGVYLCQVY